MRAQIDLKPLKISGRVLELLCVSAKAFNQPAGNPAPGDLAARPLGLDIETCRLAADVCRRLMGGTHQSLHAPELKALFHALEFARRELCAELHAQMRDLQKTMASIITARTSGEIDRLAGKLPKQAEQSARRMRAVLKKRGAQLDDCEALIRRLRLHLGLPKPVK